MTREHRSRGTVEVLLALTVLTATLVTAGCIDDGGEDGPLDIPDDRKDSKLAVGGEVQEPLNLTIEDMAEMGLEDFEATFVNSVGTTRTGNYTGLPVLDIVDLVRPGDSVDVLKVTASDGYIALLFMADVGPNTHIAVREDDEWQDLEDNGAFRIVDTNLPSTYWVRHVVSLSFESSTPLAVNGLANQTDVLTVGWVKDNAVREVSWQEGEKTRTYTGVPMDDVLTALGADTVYTDVLRFVDDEGEGTLVLVSTAVMKGTLVVDSRGGYVYVQDSIMDVDDLVVKDIVELEVSGSLLVWGEVGQEMLYSFDTLSVLPSDEVEDDGSTYAVAFLDMIVAEAAPDASVDAVRVVAGDGYSAVFPLGSLSSVGMAYLVDDGPVPLGDGPFRVIAPSMAGPYQVRWVTGVEVYTSTPVEVSGLVNVTDAVTLGSVTGGADTAVTYNDGRKDRTYDAMSWEALLAALDYNTTATQVTLEDASGEAVTWDLADLLGTAGAGLCVDARGEYVAVKGELGDYMDGVVSMTVA